MSAARPRPAPTANGCAATETRFPPRSAGRCRDLLSSSVAYPWVDPGDRHIDQDIENDEYDRVQKDQVLHHENIALGDRREHRVAETGNAERALDRDRAGQ